MTRRAIAVRLLAFARPLRPVLAASTLLRIAGQATGIALLALGAHGVARVATGDSAIASVAVALVVLSLAKGVLRYLEQYSGHYVAFKLLAMLRGAYYRAVEPHPPDGSDRSGEQLTKAMRDIDRIEVFYAHSIAPAISAVVVAVAAPLVLGIVVDPTFGLVLAPAMIVAGAVAPVATHRASARSSAQLLAQRGLVAAHLTEGVQGIREILDFDAGERRASELDALGRRVQDLRSRLGRLAAVRRALVEGVVGVAFAVQVYVGAGLLSGGSISLSELVVALAITLASFPAVLAVEEFAGSLDLAFASARRLFEQLDRPVAVSDPVTPALPDGGDIRFDDVTFGYGAGVAVQAVTFSIEPGERVAIVGASGSGKSTLVSLLARLWDPRSGTIAVGGTDVRAMTLADLRSRIAIVPQRTHLFNDTLRENLLLADPNADDARLAEACAAAGLDGISLDAVAGEHGVRLSGGERQRVAIARAVVSGAPVIVLDEATSDLDVATEARVLRSLAAMQDRTLVVVAHRLSSVSAFDRILVMDDGRLVEHGTHRSLLAKRGVYARLWERQRGDFDTVTA